MATGTTVAIVLSDLTWSWQNNVLSMIAMDWTINFWASLIGGIFDGDLLDRFGSFESISSERSGSFGVRRNGIWADNNADPADDTAWTYQHIVWASAASFDRLKDVRVFDPRAAFRPTLYGTVLRLQPAGAAPFLLTGSPRVANPPGAWTRAGGEAEAVVPGSQIPWFPSGGLHLNIIRTGLRGPLDCVCTELEVTGGLGLGTLEARAVVVVPGTGFGLAVGQFVQLVGTGGATAIGRILTLEEPSTPPSTRLRLEANAAGLAAVGTTGVTASRLDGPVPATPDALPAVDPPPDGGADHLHLDVAAAHEPDELQADDPVRVVQDANELATTIVRLEARLALDEALPNTLAPPLTAFAARPEPALQRARLIDDPASPGTLALTYLAGATPPNIGEPIVIAQTAGTVTLAAVVNGSDGARLRRVDRTLAPLGAANTRVDTRRLVRDADALGVRNDAPEADPRLTYVPARAARAPATDFLWVEVTGQIVARTITARAYDAIVLAAGLPGNPANPYVVNHFRSATAFGAGATIESEVALALQRNEPLGGVALALYQLAGAALAAGPTPTMLTALTPTVVRKNGVDVERMVGSAPFGPGVALPAAPVVGSPVVLATGATLEANVVTEVRLEVALDRALALDPALRVEVVELREDGAWYRAERRDVRRVTVRPEVALAGGALYRSQMPRFHRGECVAVRFGGVVTLRRFRIDALDGTTLDLAGDADLPAATPDLEVRRLVPITPGSQDPAGGAAALRDPTGTTRVARDGEVIAPAATGQTRLRLRVWAPDAFFADDLVGIVQGETVHPAIIPAAAAGTLQIELGRRPSAAITAPCQLSVPDLSAQAWAARFEQDGAAVLVPEQQVTNGVFAGTAANLIVAVPYGETTQRADGVLHPGTVKVPADPETWELDRRQAVIDHELTHTIQCARLGPLVLNWWPQILAEWLIAKKFHFPIDQPPVSRWVAAQLRRDGNGRALAIADFQGVDFKKGDTVEVALAGRIETVKLAAGEDASSFKVDADADVVGALPPSGTAQTADVQVRKNRFSTAAAVFDIALRVTRIGTHGGATGLVVGLTWAPLFELVLRGVHAFRRAVTKSAAMFEATVEDQGLTLRPARDEAIAVLRHASHVTVQNGDGKKTMVRVVSRVEEKVVRLFGAVPFTGTVRVGPYTLDAPDSYWDMNDWFPASAPDRARPTRVEIDDFGGRHLTLAPLDRVEVKDGNGSSTETVVAVDPPKAIELRHLPERFVGHEFRIAKVASGTGLVGPQDFGLPDWGHTLVDPLLDSENILLEAFDKTWMRWIFDPWGQALARIDPRPGSWADFAKQSARQVASTYGWSFAFPGWVVWNRQVFGGNDGELSDIEQECSEESGDLYSPVGRLRGPLDGRRRIGEIGRYWFFPWASHAGRKDRDSAEMARTRFDNPGVSLLFEPRVMPFVTDEVAGGTAPNRGATMGAVDLDPGGTLVDAFVRKRPDDPRDAVNPPPTPATVPVPTAFVASDRGWIPVSAVCERTTGIYAAFCRPGTHRLTVSDTGDPDGDGRAAQDDGEQTLLFNVTVEDVTVTLGGQPVVEGGTVTLVRTQRAPLLVVDSDKKPIDTHALGMLTPVNGTVLRVESGSTAVAQAADGTEPVEASRLYAFDPTQRRFADPALGTHGLHLPEDVHVPVRAFAVTVTEELPILDALPTIAPVTLFALPDLDRTMADGVFLACPTESSANPVLLEVTYATTVRETLPFDFAAVDRDDWPEALRAVMGTGFVVQVTFRADTPPQETVPIVFTLDVGNAPLTATLRTRRVVRLAPAFVLDDPGGTFTVAHGNTLELRCSNGQPATFGVEPPNDVTPNPINGDTAVRLDVAAGAQPSARVVTATLADGARARRTITIT